MQNNKFSFHEFLMQAVVAGFLIYVFLKLVFL
jgi:hypothetical protein